MPDWLSDLRESKNKMVADSTARASQARVERGAVITELQDAQAQINQQLQELAVEPNLLEFAREILQGHPIFSGYSLVRTITSRHPDSPQLIKEPAPWSGPVENNLLALPLDLANDHFVTELDWKLETNYRYPGHHQANSFELHVAVSVDGAECNDTPIFTADDLRANIVAVFKPIAAQTARPAQRRKHRRRPNVGKRLLRAVIPAAAFKPVYAIIAVVVLVLVLLLVLSLVPAFQVFVVNQSIGN